jgi:leader peptidase (prepilin peptidase)/N-methyltransferase
MGTLALPMRGRWMLWQVAVSMALAGLAVASLGLAPAAMPALYLAAVAPELTRIDLREHRLPNLQVLPGIGVGVAAAALSWVVDGVVPLVPLIAGAAFCVLLFVLGIRGGMGMGDVKLAAVLGLASPTLAIAVLAPMAAFMLSGIPAAVLLIRHGRGTRIAFGPFLLAGYFVVLAVVLIARVVGS